MRYLFSFLLLLSLGANAQWKSFIIGVKGDTLNRVDLKGRKQGPWVIQVPELRGERAYEEDGFFVDDLKEGRWVRYSAEGDKQAVENYRWGQKDGRCEYYNNVEDLVRIESWLAADPKNPYDTIPIMDLQDPNKILRYQVVKIESPSVKHGTWKYFDPMTGKVEKTEQWQLDRLKNPGEDQAGTLTTEDETAATKKTAEKKQVAKPKEVLEFEKKNAGKKKVKVRDGNTGG